MVEASIRVQRGLIQLVGSLHWYGAAAVGALLAALCFACLFLALTLTSPMLDEHDHRQTQTAIGIQYALRRGSLIASQTPVLGTPWSVPFEAPVYQFFVTALARTTGMGIAPAGRLIGFSFLLGTIYFGHMILRLVLPRERLAPIFFGLLVLTSPLYLFWGRAVLIETCATFFCTAWLYCAMLATRQRRLAPAALAAPLCIVAALAKATTWPAFIAAYGIFWLAEWRRAGWLESRVLAPQSLRLWGAIAGGVVAALAVTVWWIGYSDEIKSAGVLTRHLTSTSVNRWAYGTLADRFSGELWGLLPSRMLPDALGSLWIIALVALTHLKLRGPHFAAAVACVGLYFVPLALFTNLHTVHDYYQAANSLFLVAAAAIVFAGLITQGHPRMAMTALALLVAGQFIHFASGYWPKAVRDMERDPTYQAAQFVKETTRPRTALVAFGVDWNPVLHYYAERKGLAMPEWIPKETLIAFIEDPKIVVGNVPVGAVVYCQSPGLDQHPEIKDLVMRYLEVITREAEAGGRIRRFGHCTAFIGPNAGRR